VSPTNGVTQYAVNQYIGVGLTTGTEWVKITAVDSGGSGDLNVAPDLSASPADGDIIYACWTMDPADTGHESYTITAYEHAIKHVLTGCVGTFSIDGIEPDSIPKINFEFTSGGNETVSADTIPSDWCDAYADYDPPLPVGAILQIDPATAGVASKEFISASFELGQTVSRRLSPSGSAGVAAVSVTDRDAPTHTVTYNMDAETTFNPLDAMEAGTLQKIRLILGGDPSEAVIIEFRKAQTMSVQAFQENDGRETWEVVYQAKDPGDSTTLEPWVIALG